MKFVFCKLTKQRREIIPGRDKSKDTWYSVISQRMFAPTPGPAHSLSFHISEEAQSPSFTSHKPHQDFALLFSPDPKGLPDKPNPFLYF